MAKLEQRKPHRHDAAHKHSHAERQSDGQKQEEMCCDGSGRTAEEHRKESADGKCCVDE